MRADIGQSYASLEWLAQGIRRRLSVAPYGAMPPGVELFERLDEHSVSLDGEEIGLDYHVYGGIMYLEGKVFFDKDDFSIVVALHEKTYDDLKGNNPRARYTFAHELMHAFIHPREVIRSVGRPSGTYRDSIYPKRPNRDYAVYRDSEWQADAGAAALLMPAPDMERLHRSGHLNTEDVCRYFKVSHTAANKRIHKYLERRDSLLSFSRRDQHDVKK